MAFELLLYIFVKKKKEKTFNYVIIHLINYHKHILFNYHILLIIIRIKNL